MSVPHIPNLLSSRGGPRSRGRGRGAGPGRSTPSGPALRDQAIQATDTDAAVSRLSAVSLRYLSDPFAQCFVTGAGTRRLPIINRGTYVRTTALDILIDSFPSSSTGTIQIISLGAGTDTRYFRLRAHNNHDNLIYHEFDFPLVCAAKLQIVKAHEQTLLQDATIFEDAQPTPSEHTSGEWGIAHSGDGGYRKQYFCHPLDLRSLAALPALDSIPGLRADVPTLLISECCLCYLEPSAASDVMSWFTARIPALGIVLYEPINPSDAFGQVMVGNLAARGIVMPTVQVYKTLEDQIARLREKGFWKGGGAGGGGAEAETVERIWQMWIEDGERERVDGLEGLDEVEEWQMLARHYAVVWGWTKELVWSIPGAK